MKNDPYEYFEPQRGPERWWEYPLAAFLVFGVLSLLIWGVSLL